MIIWRSLLTSGPRPAPRSVPPYLPTVVVGWTTWGSSGRRCSTGGSLPAVTSSASIGASLYWDGLAAAGFSATFGNGADVADTAGAAGFAAAGLDASAGLLASAGLAGLLSAGFAESADFWVAG